ncbi:DUF3604 domain-containing protein [Coraliomargarita sp. W4R53]
MNRREYLKISALGAAAISCGRLPMYAGGPNETSSLATLQRTFAEKGCLETYSLLTRGRGLGLGALSCSEQHLTPGCSVDWVKVTYTSPKQGIAPGGAITLVVPPGPSYTKLQMEDADKPSHMRVEAAVPVELELQHPPFEIQEKCLVYKSHVQARLPKGLAAGEQITFVWQGVELDKHARRWGGDTWRFDIKVDHDADGWDEQLPDTMTLPKHTGPAKYLLVRAACMALVAEPVRLTVSAFDENWNPAQDYTGTVHFARLDGKTTGLPRAVTFTESDQGSILTEVTFEEAGYFWVTVQGEGDLFNRSNPVQIFTEEPERRLYWGDIHLHTEKSADARVWAHTTSTYEGSYNIGRYRYGLDFQANTEHHGLEQGNYSPAEWQEMQRITNAANDPGKYATIIANEYSHAEGDAIAYFKDNSIPFIAHPRDNHPVGLYHDLRPTHCALVPHHFAQNMRPFDWDKNYDAELMPVCEIFSNHGRAECYKNEPHYSNHKVATIEGQTWVDQLQSGKKLGCICSSDDHWARPGTCGLMAAWSRSGLTREGVVNALQEPQACYGTTGDRSILYFDVEEREAQPHIQVCAAAGTEIEKLEIIRNGETVYEQVGDSLTMKANWTDTTKPDACWYYVRLTLREQSVCEESMVNRKQFAWSSPVWIDA